MYDILEIYPRLPEIFERKHIADLLGYLPSRTAVHRATSRLIGAKKVVVAEGGVGRRAAKYRKLKPE